MKHVHHDQKEHALSDKEDKKPEAIKHPHYDFLMGWLGDINQKIQGKNKEGDYVSCGSLTVIADVTGNEEFRIKPREFIKGHWYPCIELDGKKRVFMYNGENFVYYIGEYSRVECASSFRFIGKSLGEVKFGGN